MEKPHKTQGVNFYTQQIQASPYELIFVIIVKDFTGGLVVEKPFCIPINLN